MRIVTRIRRTVTAIVFLVVAVTGACSSQDNALEGSHEHGRAPDFLAGATRTFTAHRASPVGNAIILKPDGSPIELHQIEWVAFETDDLLVGTGMSGASQCIIVVENQDEESVSTTCAETSEPITIRTGTAFVITNIRPEGVYATTGTKFQEQHDGTFAFTGNTETMSIDVLNGEGELLAQFDPGSGS